MRTSITDTSRRCKSRARTCGKERRTHRDARCSRALSWCSIDELAAWLLSPHSARRTVPKYVCTLPLVVGSLVFTHWTDREGVVLRVVRAKGNGRLMLAKLGSALRYDMLSPKLLRVIDAWEESVWRMGGEL